MEKKYPPIWLKFPQLKKQFSVKLNNKIKAEELTRGSRKKVWWECERGDDHLWQASMNSRLSGGSLRGCPYCAGKKAAKSNSLHHNFLKISEEWDLGKNKLSPKEVTYGSNKKVWWKCSKNNNHSWQATIKQRTLQGNTCPFCNSLAVCYPKIAEQWHPTKNGSLKPIDIAASSHKKVWWKCKEGDDHEWLSSLNTRVSIKTGCPVCSGHKFVKSNSLQSVYPEIAKQWHPVKNDALVPSKVYAYSRKKVWWKCSKGDDHVWQAVIRSRALGIGCPICSGRKVVKSNSLGTRFPEITKQWHSSKNGKITPYDVTPYSSRKVWWTCKDNNDHIWKSTVANVVAGSGCPVCVNRKITTQNNLFAQYPDMVNEWDFDKNINTDPLKLASGSRLKVWWKCKRDEEHQWLATIKDRTQKESGCPYCASKMNVSEQKMLAVIKEIFKGERILYQNRPQFLERLELDVYLPDRKLAFEYQGHQHYMPVEIFGGEKAFKKQVERDILKKKLCQINEITLLYVNYNEKISKDLVKGKIKGVVDGY